MRAQMRQYHRRLNKKKKKEWRLETSIWANRPQWSDSKSFYDEKVVISR